MEPRAHEARALLGFLCVAAGWLLCAAGTVPILLLNRITAEAQALPAAASHGEGMTKIDILGRQFNGIELTRGRAIYMVHCSICHGRTAQGQYPDAPLRPDATGRYGAPPHNETGHTWHHSDTLLIRYVTEGGFADPARFYQMPAFGKVLTQEEIVLVLAYIKTLWTDEQRARQHMLTLDELARVQAVQSQNH